MKEIGGYIELDTYTGAMLHEKAIALNCGRGALEYLCEAKTIRKLYLPYFLCDSVPNLCKKIDVEYEFYHINRTFEPVFTKEIGANEWLYIVNFYGQLSNEYLQTWKQRYDRVIVDNAQSYFQMDWTRFILAGNTLVLRMGRFCIRMQSWIVSFRKMSLSNECTFCWDDMNAAQMSSIVNMYRTISCLRQNR